MLFFLNTEEVASGNIQDSYGTWPCRDLPIKCVDFP